MRAFALLTGAFLLLGTVSCGSSLTGAQGGCSGGSGTGSAERDAAGVTMQPRTASESDDQGTGCQASGRLDGSGGVVFHADPAGAARGR